MTDFSKYLEEGMALLYEVRPDGSKSSRWDQKKGAKGFQDHGYTDEFAASFIELIAEQKTSTHTNTGAYVRLANEELFCIPFPDHLWYDPKQWNLPGFFAPAGGWGHYLNQNKQVECSCGAVGYAKAMREPVTGHGPLCQITQMGL